MSNNQDPSSISGDLYGAVTDSYDEPLPGVTIVLSGPELEIKMSATSNENGHFRFLKIPAGIYNIKAALDGFSIVVLSDIRIKPHQTRTIKLSFEEPPIKECVVVSPPKMTKEDLKIEKIEDAIDDLSVGKYIFNPPNKMKVGIVERIELRISQNIEEDLTKKLKGKGVAKIDKLITSSVMKAKLGGDKFKIDALSEEQQIISTEGYTQWEWNVKPLKSGLRILRLSISILILLDKYGEKIKSLPVVEKEVSVKVNLGYNLKKFLRKNWKWIIGTIISILGVLIALKIF